MELSEARAAAPKQIVLEAVGLAQRCAVIVLYADRGLDWEVYTVIVASVLQDKLHFTHGHVQALEEGNSGLHDVKGCLLTVF